MQSKFNSSGKQWEEFQFSAKKKTFMKLYVTSDTVTFPKNYFESVSFIWKIVLVFSLLQAQGLDPNTEKQVFC